MYCFKGTSKGANTFDVGSHFETSLSACRLDLEPPGPGHRAELGRGLLGGAADPRGEEDLQRPQGGTRGRATAQWGSGPLVFFFLIVCGLSLCCFVFLLFLLPVLELLFPVMLLVALSSGCWGKRCWMPVKCLRSPRVTSNKVRSIPLHRSPLGLG